jgi:endonuclease G
MSNSPRKLFILAFLLSLSILSCNRTVQVDSFVPPPEPEPRAFTHLDLGNPTKATEDPNNKDNFLLKKSTYAISYNNALRHANWVSWELNSTYLGSTGRTNSFAPDALLPMDFIQVRPDEFFTTGFDRGHVLPSADRTFNSTENRETFLMTNMLPQAPDLNRKSWNNLEQYCRDLVRSGYTLFVVAGAYGTGGDGSAGAASSVGDGVNVPQRNYKVIVATRETSVSKITNDAIVIATDFPNSNEVANKRDWVRFITTATDIEKDAKISLFTGLSTTLQNDFRKRLFAYEDARVSVDTPCKQFENRSLYVGKSGGCYYFTSGGNKSYVDRSLCDCE